MVNGKLLSLHKLFFVTIPTLFNCLRSGLPFDNSWKLVGAPVVIRRKWYERVFAHHYGGTLKIGKHFNCNNTIASNSIGLIQPCVFDIAIDGSQIIIGDNVGISGSTLNAATSIVIEDNVLIGSGCVITDTDSHPLDYEARVADDSSKTCTSPILIKEGAFIGARCFIMKGVTIGKHAIIGAGSVVTKSIPDHCIACGNPAAIIRDNKK